MTGYKVVNLNKLLKLASDNNEQFSESDIKSILADFSCPLNKDVENFLRFKAIDFAKQGIAQTHIVLTPYKGSPVIVGYFTLANKYIHVDARCLSSKWKSRIRRFGRYDHNLKAYVMSAPLIAQLGKNFTDGYNKLITGKELLKMACDMVETVQLNIGGKITYVECEDKPILKEFYESYGFCCFGVRQLERDETELFKGEYLLQLIKYIS